MSPRTPKARIDDQSRRTRHGGDIVYKDRETVEEILDDIVPGGVLDAVAITDEGGLNVSWAAGEIYDPAGHIVETEAGSGACTDDAVNCIKWVSGTTLTLSTTMPDVHAGEVCVGTIACQNGDIWEVHETPLVRERVPFLVASMSGTLPLVVAVGNDLLVTEDANADNTHDVISAAGTYYHNMTDVHNVAEIVSRNVATPMVRWSRTAGDPADWSNDTNAEIDAGFWDQDGVGKVAVNVGKYYRCVLLVSPTQIHLVLPQDEYNNEAQAIAGNIPDIPPGLASFPLSTTYVFQANEAAMGVAGGLRWADVRPIIGAPAYGGVITNAAIGPGASTDTAIALWDGAGGYTLKNSLVTISPAGAIITPSTIAATGTVTGGNLSTAGVLAATGGSQLHTIGWGVSKVRFGSAAESIANDGGGTMTIAAGTAVAITQATSIATSLTTPLVIGGALAASPLTLQSTSHGSPANDYIDFKTMGSRMMRLSGDVTARTHTLVLGAAVPVDAFADRVIVTTDAYFSVLACYAHTAGSVTQRAQFRMARSRGTAAVPVTVNNGDYIGGLGFAGYTNDYYTRAGIRALVDGAPSGATVPMAMLFLTGTGGPIERMRITSAGVINTTGEVEFDNHTVIDTNHEMRFRSANNAVYSPAANQIKMKASGVLWLQGSLLYFNIASNTEAILGNNTLTFQTTGATPSLYWGGGATQLDIRGGGGVTRFSADATGLSFYAGTPIAKPTVSGARDVPEEALADLLVELANLNLITDSTTAS